MTAYDLHVPDCNVSETALHTAYCSTEKNGIYGVKSCFLGLIAIFGIRNILVNYWILLSNFL
jgi:hypothetical protein